MKKKTNIIIVVGFLLLSLLSSINSQSVNVAGEINVEHTNALYTSEDLPIKEWSDTKVVSTESTGMAYNPSVAIDSNENVHVVWRDATDYLGSGTDYDIFYKYWDYSFQNWSTTELVSTESTGFSSIPSIVIDSAENIHIVWSDKSDGDYDIRYRCWNSTIKDWEASANITETNEDCSNPSLAVDSQFNLHITYEDFATANSQIRYVVFNSTTKVVSSNQWVSVGCIDDSFHSSIVLDSQENALIVWSDRSDYHSCGTDVDIFYTWANAKDDIVTSASVISTESTGGSYEPSIALDSSGYVHIVWKDETDYLGSGTDWDIFYRTLDWSTREMSDLEIIPSSGDSRIPSIAIDNQRTVFIFWSDNDDIASCGTDYDIFYRYCSDSTHSWSPRFVLSTESTANSFCPVIALDNLSNIFAVWQDDTDYLSCGTDRDIFYKQYFAPPLAPDLAFIEPNPSYDGEIHLDWNDMFTALEYYIYRSSSYIWSVEDLEPISVVSDSNYSETLSITGEYFYTVTANNYIGNSSHSNCQSVEVTFTEDSLPSPILSFILPNPTDISSVALLWDEITGASMYYVYRSTSYIWSIEGLNPIETVFGNNHIDHLPSEDHYFYVIVASDGLINSSISNCENVYYELPHVDEFTITTSLILSVAMIVLVISRIRKHKKS